MGIIIDAMGGDHAPFEIVKGCVEAVKELNIDLSLVGKEDIIKSHLANFNAPMERFIIYNASEVINNDESPVMAIKKKKDSSMVKGFEMLRQNPNSVFISAGSTGALMAGGLLKVGRIKGIDRPALAPVLPNRGKGTLLIDAGANAECKIENLLQFAVMGSIYMERVMGRKKPTVGLLNIGSEESKGNELYKAAHLKLKEISSINFIGNIEAREVPEGVVDVLVCDGFVGNIVLKFMEGMALTIFDMLKIEFTRSFSTKMGALLLKPGLKNFKKNMDYAEYGGAPLLGVNGGVIKAHGSSNARAFKNAIRQGKIFLENEVLSNIKESANLFKED